MSSVLLLPHLCLGEVIVPVSQDDHLFVELSEHHHPDQHFPQLRRPGHLRVRPDQHLRFQLLLRHELPRVREERVGCHRSCFMQRLRYLFIALLQLLSRLRISRATRARRWWTTTAPGGSRST